MKILVTGAAGFLGSNIVRILLKNGHKAVCMIRKTTDLKGLQGVNCEFVYGSIENMDEVEYAMKGTDGVIHAASIYTHPTNDYDEFSKVNIRGTENLVKMAIKYKLEKFVFISTANTLAPGSLEIPGTELNDFNSFHLGSHYLNTKYIAEQFVLEQVERSNLNASIIYPTFMIGANDSKPSSGRLILYGIHNSWIFAPPGGKNFVHVLDVATICVKMLTKEQPGENYLIAGQNYSYEDFFRILAQVSGKKRSILVIPKWIFFIAAYCFQMIKGKDYEFNLTNARVLGRDNYYSGDKAYNDFSYTPIPIEIALKDALEWFEKTGIEKL